MVDGLGQVGSGDLSWVMRGALLIEDAVGPGNRCVLEGCDAVVTKTDTGMRSVVTETYTGRTYIVRRFLGSGVADSGRVLFDAK
jgi:hypothetical protein